MPVADAERGLGRLDETVNVPEALAVAHVEAGEDAEQQERGETLGRRWHVEERVAGDLE